MENDMGGMLGAILSDPSAVAQIAALAKNLGPALEGKMRPPEPPSPPPPPPEQGACPPPFPVPVRPAGEISAIAKCCALLEALRMFTDGERRGKIEKLLSVMKLAQNVI
ncbi:MAG: hypothetical protein J5940_07390 [Clostridia bacterium]|nr:hypothetical protein [Clostridia bacterium]